MDCLSLEEKLTEISFDSPHEKYVKCAFVLFQYLSECLSLCVYMHVCMYVEQHHQ